ncbi:MAG: hypothetical protein ABL971_12570 [Vicinamibacterales bacterium]
MARPFADDRSTFPTVTRPHVNLAWSAWLYAHFLRRRGSFAALERWQVAYLPAYSVWAALVVVFFPALTGDLLCAPGR